jgi:RNA 2',3'-cyclic 3'-phosphodiesterase
MSKRIRTFIAIDVSPAVRKQLVALQDELRAVSEDVKWVEPENLHLTLKFLGDVDETDLYAVCKMVARAVADLSAFAMDMCGVGAFPSAGRPRVIWAGVGQGAQELTHIHGSLDKVFGAEGYPREDRLFTPHLTLGRVRQQQRTPRLAGALHDLSKWEGGITPVHEILVLSSQLSPNGPTHTIMGRGRLEGSGD